MFTRDRIDPYSLSQPLRKSGGYWYPISPDRKILHPFFRQKLIKLRDQHANATATPYTTLTQTDVEKYPWALLDLYPDIAKDGDGDGESDGEGDSWPRKKKAKKPCRFDNEDAFGSASARLYDRGFGPRQLYYGKGRDYGKFGARQYDGSDSSGEDDEPVDIFGPNLERDLDESDLAMLEWDKVNLDLAKDAWEMLKEREVSRLYKKKAEEATAEEEEEEENLDDAVKKLDFSDTFENGEVSPTSTALVLYSSDGDVWSASDSEGRSTPNTTPPTSPPTSPTKTTFDLPYPPPLPGAAISNVSRILTWKITRKKGRYYGTQRGRKERVSIVKAKTLKLERDLRHAYDRYKLQWSALLSSNLKKFPMLSYNAVPWPISQPDLRISDTTLCKNEIKRFLLVGSVKDKVERREMFVKALGIWNRKKFEKEFIVPWEEESVKNEVLDSVEVVQKHIESLEEEFEPQQAEIRKKRKRDEEEDEKAGAEKTEREAKRVKLIENAENFVKRSVTRVVRSLRRKRVVNVYQ